MRAFKGFGRDMKCRGFQYEEGRTYGTEKAELCKEGFHACELPLDCLSYYKPNTSVYHEVGLAEPVIRNDKDGDSKVCSSKIKIGCRMSIKDLVKAEIEVLKEKVKPTTGYTAHAATTGDSAHAATTGDSAHAATTGYSAHAATTGYTAHAATTGNYAHAATTGDSAHAATTGNYAHAATTGNYAHAATTGDSAHAEANGNNSIAAALGINSVVKGAIGVWLVCAEYEDGKLVCVKTAVVDGKGIKPDTWYAVKDGEFVLYTEEG